MAANFFQKLMPDAAAAKINQRSRSHIETEFFVGEISCAATWEPVSLKHQGSQARRLQAGSCRHARQAATDNRHIVVYAHRLNAFN